MRRRLARLSEDSIMSRPERFALLICATLALGLAHECAHAAEPTQTSTADPARFAAGTVEVRGARLHYRRGGAGPPVILVHGFPEDGSAYDRVMPRLARTFTVVVPDLRGIGRSVALTPAFDAQSLAADLAQLAAALKLDRPYVVGHDMGGIVAHAAGRLHPRQWRGVMLIENPLPGLQPWDEIAADPQVWHINFQQAPVAETLIAGRQERYFQAQFFTPGLQRKDAIDAGRLKRYAAAYRSAEQLRAGLGLYRATPANAAFNQSRRDAIATPLALIGGEKGIGRGMARMADDLRAHGWSRVTLEMVGGAHYLLDESPDEIAAAIEKHAAL
jgi:pimeloyl-ACP methyl ester carboxylesterase